MLQVWNLSLTDISSTYFVYEEMQSGLPVFLVGEFSTFETFFAKITVWKSLLFHIPPTTNIKDRSYLGRI